MELSIAEPKRAYVPAIRWRAAVLALELKLRALGLFFKAGYDPGQPRVPAGEPDGGQWTGGGAADDGSFQVAQASPRGGSRGGGIGAAFPDASPSQVARLAVSQSKADAALARVQKYDQTWTPRPGVSETIEGVIADNIAREQEANSRYVEQARERVGLGPYFVEGVPGRGPFVPPTDADRDALQKLGDRDGCHTCGRRTPNTGNGRWIWDHQTPSALGGPNAGSIGACHCAYCSPSQGGTIRNILRYK